MKKNSNSGILILLIILLVGVGISDGFSDDLVSPTLTSTPTQILSPIPLGIEDERIWRVIEVGIENAKANGIECDPFLLLALQEVFTGGVFCDETWQEVERPNECAPEKDVVGMFYFYIPTFERNARRYDVEGSVWDPAISAEVVCYFIHDEANISLNQTKEEFVSEFVEKGFIWNIFVYDAQRVYNKGRELMHINQKVQENENH
jgi:hypothetical protein